ncbi:Lrp/AsnC ligand binding domain-containing protein [Streptomyces sp. NBC_01089]|nr:Lrp/AsnC ligand binding domain-containing protein [Streptomyces sp. NBC_01089]
MSGVRCPTRSARTACLTRLPWVVSVLAVAGEYGLFITVGAVDMPALRRALRDDVSTLPGVGDVRVRLLTAQSGAGSPASRPHPS